MKKSTLANMIAYLNGDDSVDLTILKEELTEEWNRTAAKAEEKKAARDKVAAEVMRVLTNSDPLTVKELYARLVTDDVLPDDYSERSLMWLVSHDLAAKLTRHEDGRNPYKYSVK